MKFGQNFDLTSIAARNKITEQEVLRYVARARRFSNPDIQHQSGVTITRQSAGMIENAFGKFYIYRCTTSLSTWGEYDLIFKCADLDENDKPVFDTTVSLPVRIDSGCVTGQKYQDSGCDCQEQLIIAMDYFSKIGQGVIIHIPDQEGRGRGSQIKFPSIYLDYVLGLSTAEANDALNPNFPLEARTYQEAVLVFGYLGYKGLEIELLTNNPKKIQAFEEADYVINPREIIAMDQSRYAHHQSDKARFLNHTGISQAVLLK